jgi:hypothetical protein
VLEGGISIDYRVALATRARRWAENGLRGCQEKTELGHSRLALDCASTAEILDENFVLLKLKGTFKCPPPGGP